MEKNKVYREISLKRVSSPEQLNNYIRTVNVGTWVALGAIIAILIGAFVWCSVVMLGTENVKSVTVVKNGTAYVYFSQSDKNSVSGGMKYIIEGKEFELPEIEVKGVKLYNQTDSKVIELLGEDGENYVYFFKIGCNIPNGIYESKIVSAEISPLELFFN